MVNHRKSRALAVIATVLSALALWLLARLVLDLRAPAIGAAPPAPIPTLWVALVVTGVSVAAWALLAVLERLVRRPRTVWLTIATLIFAASLAAPWQGTGVTTPNRIALTLMHVLVAALLIPLLGRTARARRSAPS